MLAERVPKEGSSGSGAENWPGAENFDSLGLNKTAEYSVAEINETYDLVSISTIKDDKGFTFKTKIRIDTAMEWNYFKNDGILNYVLKNIVTTH